MQAPPLQHLKQLQELLLQDCRVSNKVLAQLPASLRVLVVAIENTSEQLPRLILNSSNTARLRQLSSLQGLYLSGVGLQDSAGLLAALSQLTSLTLDGSFWEERAVPKAPLRGLTNLRELCFVRNPVDKLELLQDLPPSLTRLELIWLGASVPDPDAPASFYGPATKSIDVLDAEAAPSIAQLTALRRLHLLCAQLENANTEALRICPSLVQQLQQLQELRLDHIAGCSPTMLLDALQSMTQMQHLELHFSSDIYPLEDEEMQQYAALTASSQLTCLKLLDDNDGVAYGAAQYMFAAGKQLPKLKQLHLGSYAIRWAADNEPLKPFGEGDIARLAAACPALEHFQAIGAIQGAADIGSLAQLTAVTQMVIGGVEVDGSQLAAALLQLQQLRELEITGTPSFGAADLVRLTRLTNLRRLAVDACEQLPGVLDEVFLAPMVSPADTISVSEQLRSLCMRAVAQSILHLEEEDQ
ncbi:hypothetical protein OEZ85_009355 [Tetradesmus obliquus]|uniref:Uncharacterized protein n=1 Tax=Tetradesmus obliquus TaxID=3088 RepID=A0ABY8U918_TETOB|nr:hypothetical protein OEZ85_009355 [Tetradesmus obliquus]